MRSAAIATSTMSAANTASVTGATGATSVTSAFGHMPLGLPRSQHIPHCQFPLHDTLLLRPSRARNTDVRPTPNAPIGAPSQGPRGR